MDLGNSRKRDCTPVAAFAHGTTGTLYRVCGALLAVAIQGSAWANDPVPDSSPSPPSAATTQPAASAVSVEAAPNGLKGMSLEELMNVEVTTVTRTQSTVGQSPAAVFVITPEMIRRSGALTIPELFRMVPGMDVAQVNSSTWAVGARGFSSAFGANFENNLLVQVDGRSVYNPIFAGVFWDTVDYPLQDIERIEVVRGPGGAVWGANAVDGVINIITKPADETQGGLISGGGGTVNQGFGDVRYGSKLGDNTYYRVYAKGISRDDDFSSIGEPHDGWIASRGGFRIDSHPNDPNKFTLQGDYFNSDARGFTEAATPAPPHFTSKFSEISNGENILGRWTHQVDPDSSWSLQTYFDHVERDNYNGLYDLSWSTYDLDFQHNFPIGDRQKFIYGLEYRFNDSVLAPSPSGITVGANRARESITSGFVQDQVALVPEHLVLTLGTKLEYNTFTRFEVQPSGRLLWSPDSRQSVWAAISRTVRTPDVLEHSTTLAERNPATGRDLTVIAANPDIDSETVIAYELGYRVQATEAVALDTAAFYNDYSNISILVPTSAAPIPFNFENKMRGKSYGIEVGATYRPVNWWQLRAAYTLQEIQYHADASLIEVLKSTYDESSKQSPQNQFYLQSGWDLPHHLELDLISRYVQTTGGFSAPATTVPSYISLDARLGWKPRESVELAVVGQNLLDNHHPEFGGGTPVEIRRGVYGTITYRW